MLGRPVVVDHPVEVHISFGERVFPEIAGVDANAALELIALDELVGDVTYGRNIKDNGVPARAI